MYAIIDNIMHIMYILINIHISKLSVIYLSSNTFYLIYNRKYLCNFSLKKYIQISIWNAINTTHLINVK